MGSLGKSKLNDSQRVMQDDEMKAVIGGYTDYGGHVVDYGGCTPDAGVCQGSCPDFTYNDSKGIPRSMPRYCVPLNHVNGPAVSCVCATKDATGPWG